MAARRESPASPDHHLWRNGRLWWVAFTVHLPPWHKERVRLSLQTDDLDEARRRRDELLSRYPRERDCTLSLRVPTRSKKPREESALVPNGAKPQRGSEPWCRLPDPAETTAHEANL